MECSEIRVHAAWHDLTAFRYASCGLRAMKLTGELSSADDGEAGSRDSAARRLRDRVRPIEPAPVRGRLEAVGQAHHGLGGAEHQIAVALGDPRHAVEHADLGRLIKI